MHWRVQDGAVGLEMVSGWCKSAIEPLMQLKKKLRPMWLDATIIMALGVRDVSCAWHLVEAPCYQVH